VQSLAGRLMTSQMQWSAQSVVNIVATNIPGPQFPFYTGGAELLDIWPFVSIYHSLGLNIAIVSYNGSVFFGMLADRDLVPDLANFAKHLEQSIADFREAALVRHTPAVSREKRSSRAPGARKKTAKYPVDLGVDHKPVVASPNGDRGNVGSEAAAEVHHVV
jgi:WS/DGAT C-terminal domain